MPCVLVVETLRANQAIVDDVESGGTKSLIAQAMRLGDIKSESDPLLLGPAEMRAAYDELTEAEQQVLLRTKVCDCCCCRLLFLRSCHCFFCLDYPLVAAAAAAVLVMSVRMRSCVIRRTRGCRLRFIHLCSRPRTSVIFSSSNAACPPSN